MNKHHIFRKLAGLFALCILLASTWSCSKEPKAAAGNTPPAKVQNGVKESALTTVTLSPQAEQRLGVETVIVERRKLPRALELGGEIIAPPGREVTIAAPVAGVVLAANGTEPQAGMTVRKGQAVFRLLPLPAGQDFIGAPEEVALKKTQYRVTLAKAERARQLLQDKAGSEKALQEAQAELAIAEAAYKSAEARLQLSNSHNPDSDIIAHSTMALAAPFDGVVQHIDVAPRQNVAAGTALFQIASQNPVWVRTPVYVGDLSSVDRQQPARISSFGAAKDGAAFEAQPVQGPTLSDANAASTDLYFELQNTEQRFRIGEKVAVSVVQQSERKGLVVPVAAILYDIQGGTWVYVKTAPQVYTRQRIELQYVVGELALLARGPEAGAEVVTAGVAEIFGTEFGGGK
ncbi:MAG: efflux RND transporter periplasmic adaptor subunit [Deferribacteres bacterium]|nr:efflux RND transporter periplasmic adaptor subunit [Deferribacteres bacterium]